MSISTHNQVYFEIRKMAEHFAVIHSAVLFFVLLAKCSAQHLVFHIEVLNSSNSAELNSLVRALNESNARTSTQGKNAFVLNVRESLPGPDLAQYATSLPQQGVVALIDGLHPSATACMLSTLTGIPLVRLNGHNDCCPKCDHVVSLAVGQASYARAIRSLLDTFKWDNVAVVFEETWFRDTMQLLPLITEWSPHYLLFSKRENESMDDTLMRMMKRMASLDVEVVLLNVNKMYYEKILTTEPCDLERSYVWILQGEVSSHLTTRSDYVVLALGLRLNLTTEGKENIMLAYDAGRVISQAVTDMSNSEDWVPLPNGSLLHDGPVAEKKMFLQRLKNVSLSGKSGNIEFDVEGRRTSVELDVSSLRDNTFVKIGSWTPNGLNLTSNLRKNQEVKQNAMMLEGRKFRIVTVEEPPFVIFHRRDDQKIDYEGYCIDVLNKLASELKFTYEIHPSPDGFYGANINGRWNGAVGNLLRKSADMVVASLTLTDEREKVVDFTVAYMQYTSDLIMKKDVSEKVDYLQFVQPFNGSVWIMLLVCFLVMSLATYAVNYFSPYGYKNATGTGTSTEFNLPNSAWFSLACMLQQGGDNTPKSLSGRILAGCFWFCILIWISTYTANLAAFLTVKNTHYPISSLEDALNSDYDIGVKMASATYDFFRSSNFPLYKRAWSKMESKNMFPINTSEGIQWARERKFVFIENGPTLHYEANKEPCDLVAITGLTIDRALGFALSTNDPHTDEISLGILHLLQEGYMEELREKWWNSKVCSNKAENGHSSQRIDIESMLGVYIVLSIGVLASFIVLAAENLWHNVGQAMLANYLQNRDTKRRNPHVVNVQPMEDTY